MFALPYSSAASEMSRPVDSVEYYISTSHYLKGLKFAKEKAAYLLRRKDYLEYSKVIVQKAEMYNILNDNEKALRLLFDALKLVSKEKQTISEVILIRKVGAIYTRMKDYGAAKKYYYKALAKAKRIKNDSLIGRLNQPLYKIHVITESDSAFFYLQKSMAYSKSIGTPEVMTTAHNNYFYYYNTFSDYKNAKIHLDSAVYYAKRTNSNEKKSIALTNLVYYLVVVEDDLKKARKTYNEIFELSPNDTVSSQTADLYYGYADILSKLGEEKLANYYLTKSLEIKEANFDAKTTSAVRDVELRYRLNEVEQEFLQKQRQLEANESRKKKILSVFLALCVFIIILFYFFHQNAKLKQNNKLKDIESQIQLNIINATIDGQEIERKKIASVLHDNISAMLSSAGLHLSAFVAGHQEQSEEIAKTRSILKETHDKVRDLSHELVPTLLLRFGLLYALQDLCEKYSNSALKFHCTINADSKQKFAEDYEMKVYFIINELLNNIIKHRNATTAVLDVGQSNDELTIVVGDNGKGFDISRSNSDEGFGLTQIRARINKMNGTLNISSRPNNGTTINIKVPIER